MKRKVGQGFMTIRFSLLFVTGWFFEKSRRSPHFVCTCFIVVGTRLSTYRQLPMEVCIFFKCSKLGGKGRNVQPINFNLDYYCPTRDIYTFETKLLFNISKWLIKIRSGLCNFCIEKYT